MLKIVSILLRVSKADLNYPVGSISDLKLKGPGFESRIKQGIRVERNRNMEKLTGAVVLKNVDTY
jgi:hypothetical protein